MSLFVLDASVPVVWLLSERNASKAEMALVCLESDEALVAHFWK